MARPRFPLLHQAGRLLVRAGVALAAVALSACASLPPPVPRAESFALDGAHTTLARIVDASTPADAAGLSGFRLLSDADHAWDARLALIEHAEVSIDAQYYTIAADASGRAFIGALRAAAARGVRVRLLVDDLFAQASAPLLEALAADPNAKVRLFNPLPARSGPLALRLALSLHEFDRINRRMHNKLLLADNRLAISGGRNIGDEYFSRQRDSFFIDLDLLSAGAAVRELSALFDRFWNSAEVRPLQELGLPAPTAQPIDTTPAPPRAVSADALQQPPLSQALAAGRLALHWAEARLLADPPERASRPTPPRNLADDDGGAMLAAITALAQGEHELFVVSPYFIPGAQGLSRIAEATARGLRVRVLTNSAAATDEPLAYWRYAGYRPQVAALGVEVYELSASLAARRHRHGSASASSAGRLHGKWAVADQRRVLVGSMNMDYRSAWLNTELGLLIDSPELARALLHGPPGQVFEDAYRVHLDDGGLQWHAVREAEVPAAEPGLDLARQLALWLLSLLVPEELL